MATVHQIAPEDQTRWYREYWLKVAAACLVGLGLLGSVLMVALYFVVKAAMLAALDEHVRRLTEGLSVR